MNKRIVHRGFFTLEVINTPEGKREVLRSTDSINILVLDPEKHRIILLKQPRASMISTDNPRGLHVETIAGRFDVNLGPKALAVKELKEEAGITVSEDQIEFLNQGRPMTVSAGATDEKAYLAFVELKPGQIEREERAFGAEDEGEDIERVYVCIDDLEEYVCEDVRVFALIQYMLLRLKK